MYMSFCYKWLHEIILFLKKSVSLFSLLRVCPETSEWTVTLFHFEKFLSQISNKINVAWIGVSENYGIQYTVVFFCLWEVTKLKYKTYILH